MNNYILALTSGLLSFKKEGFDKALDHFSKLYELQQPARPGYMSIAGANNNNEPVNYLQWLREIRAEYRPVHQHLVVAYDAITPV